ncbi:3-hydroxyacyl-CoA dehydrogenase NAD-binding domain-containing protein [Methylobacterium nodulans]|uniref:3-hydroxyacyl-CoA dehydrogenase NAD-binding n=1 Tax=Methylobacterium nodulans (strain LMG 21967 / CNCM I-2342 / ORS 2060) TaxID=460265 RepID=B8IJY1_METNO|nr:3-hydroxyacyl-CoA dehydrogenase NAD-binding domain-containing protein [Methylobacterium nodulans]ACL59994.1 3-hydroxyacyl-CoA dehydrogenase NAD-binding [Methylobacterium nodulans ORS 2060]
MAQGGGRVQRAAVIGCGTVGASWAALFLVHGLDVTATDPAEGAEERLRAFVEGARAQLAGFGLTGSGRLRFVPRVPEALDGAEFVQENAPETEALKRALLAEIDRLLPPQVLVASSTSALLRSAIVADCARPERVLVAHPFNPPHLVPLVEIVAGDAATAARAAAFYRGLGRRPVILRREMPGHIANRLASALYREAVNLVAEGVASVADIDAALCHGPGLRWAAMGPHMTYHLGGGAGGIAHYLAHLGPSQERRWASLGNPALTPEVQAAIVAGVAEEAAGLSVAELEARRDRALVGILKARETVAPDPAQDGTAEE